MDELIAALTRCTIFFQDTIHGPSRAEILTFIEQGGVDRRGRAILEAFGIQHRTDGFAFVRTQRPSWSWPSAGDGRRSWQLWPEQRALAVERSGSHSENVAGRFDTDSGRELQDGVHYGFSSGSTVEIGRPNSVATFF